MRTEFALIGRQKHLAMIENGQVVDYESTVVWVQGLASTDIEVH